MTTRAVLLALATSSLLAQGCAETAHTTCDAAPVDAAPMDATPDVAPDVTPDVTPDVAPDVARDVAPDAPEPPGPLNAVAAGIVHTCVLRAGRVFCWGDNTGGQLGVSGVTESRAAVEVPGVRDAVEVGANGNTTCVRRIDNSVVCWGQNISGQLGASAPIGTDRVGPTAVAGVRDALSLSVGSGFACMTRLGGTVWCWGSNAAHQLGDGAGGMMGARSATPVQARGLTRITQVAAAQSVCAVRDDGRVFCWGINGLGETGVMAAPTPTPTEVPGVAGAVQVAVGIGFGCAATQGGQVLCWGDNSGGQLGDRPRGSRLPAAAVPGVTDAVAVTCAVSSTCALRRDGTVVCWGTGARGELGTGTLSQSSLAPVAVAGLTDVAAISGFPSILATRGNHRCALRTTDTARLWCWGFNGQGQVGDDSATDRAAPVRVTVTP